MTIAKANQALRRFGWRFRRKIALREPRLTTIFDQHNPVPEYEPDKRIDPAAAVRLRQLIASRQHNSEHEKLDIKKLDMDTAFRSIASRDTVVRVEEPSIVEPGDGWTILRRGIPLDQSHYTASLIHNSIGRKVYSHSPSPKAWLAAVTVQPPEMHLPEAISLLDWLAGNYVHFLDLIVNRIRLANEVGISDEIPLLLPASRGAPFLP